MLSRLTLSAEQEELTDLAAALVDCVGAPAPRPDAVGRIRWQLTRKLLAHLAKEDNLLYPLLKAGSDARAAALAHRFADEMGDLAHRYRAYIADWPADRIAADWRGFGLETRRIVQTLNHRIMREETALYALLPGTPPQPGRTAA